MVVDLFFYLLCIFLVLWVFEAMIKKLLMYSDVSASVVFPSHPASPATPTPSFKPHILFSKQA